MKYSIIVILLFICQLSIGQSFNIVRKNLNIKVKELIEPAKNIELTHAVYNNNKYYCFFKERKKNNPIRDLKFFMIISEDGSIVKNIVVPKEIMNTIYFDLFIQNDSILVKLYMDSKTFWYDTTNSSWIHIEDAEDILYEDKMFKVTYIDYGEWGKTTWFIDKQTGVNYELASGGNKINKVGNSYYITSGLRVLRIDDPLKLKECDADNYYEIAVNQEYGEGTNSLEGTEVIFSDTVYSFWDRIPAKLTIATSFVHQNQLYHLCMDSTSSFIAILRDGEMIPVKKIGADYYTYDWYYSYRGKIQDNQKQMLKFKTSNRNKFGFIRIDDNNIRIDYLYIRYY